MRVLQRTAKVTNRYAVVAGRSSEGRERLGISQKTGIIKWRVNRYAKHLPTCR